MAKFNRKDFHYHGGYLTYPVNGEYKFVARFKYNKKDKPGFLTFLINNFTVEEYMEQAEAHDVAPLKILRSKGYMPKTVKEILSAAGYPMTEDGYDKYIKDQVTRYRKAA